MSSSPPTEFDGHSSTSDGSDPANSRQQRAVKRIQELYSTGKPLFPRAVFEDLVKQLDQGKKLVIIKDYQDVKHAQYWSDTPDEDGTVSCVIYNSHEYLTCLRSYDVGNTCPVEIGHRFENPKCRSSLSKLKNTFDANRKKWEFSRTCAGLKRQLESLTIAVPIKKIVCFGLGALDNTNPNWPLRSFAQHAAVLTVRDFLQTIDNVKCYAQDPAYNERDKELLASLGITPLEDPRGFLAIDQNTLVFSVSPNAPVKEIVTDIQWPAAMIWDTVDEDHATYRAKHSSKLGTSELPFLMDPCSPRVCAMMDHYDEAPIEDPEDFFGFVSIYTR